MVSFYAFPVIFIDIVLFKKGTLIKRAGVRTPWTPPGSAPGTGTEIYTDKKRRLFLSRVERIKYFENLYSPSLDR